MNRLITRYGFQLFHEKENQPFSKPKHNEKEGSLESDMLMVTEIPEIRELSILQTKTPMSNPDIERTFIV